uniref:ADP-ribosylation factor-like 13A n=1 Tax=Myripristis murdjan TaxID=586833 RepID=A0A667ZTF4_9TELE
MFNLMSNCCTWVSKIQEPIRKVTVLMVGLDKAGKTSSIRGMMRVAHTLESGPTHGCVRSELRVENYLVTLLDTGGAPEWRATWKEHYGEAHGIIFVVDASDRQRMKEVKELLTDLLKQSRVAGKPILVLANKQDKINALLGSELIEILSLEKLVNQSRSLCHIEPCSALMDLRRWSDRKTLRGLRWLLRAVCLDYPELCARVAHDSKTPLAPEEREKPGKTEKGQFILDCTNSLQMWLLFSSQENTLKKKLRGKKKKQVKIKNNDQEEENDQEEDGEGNDGEQEQSGQKEKASSALITPKRGKLKRKAKVKEETLDVPESPENEEKASKGTKGDKGKKKKVVKVKRKNKINTEEVPAAYTQPVDLSATFDLYRKAILALKERQEQGQ